VAKSLGVKSARATGKGFVVTPLLDIYRMNTRNVSDGVLSAWVNNYLNDAIRQGNTLMFMFHNVADSMEGEAATCVTTAVFQQIVDLVASRIPDIEVLTISEFYNGLENPRRLVSR